MNILLISLSELYDLYFKPIRSFLRIKNKVKKAKLIYSIKQATFAIRNEQNYFDPACSEDVLFYVNMDQEPQGNDFFLLDREKNHFKIMTWHSDVMKKYNRLGIIGVIVDIFPDKAL